MPLRMTTGTPVVIIRNTIDSHVHRISRDSVSCAITRMKEVSHVDSTNFFNSKFDNSGNIFDSVFTLCYIIYISALLTVPKHLYTHIFYSVEIFLFYTEKNFWLKMDTNQKFLVKFIRILVEITGILEHDSPMLRTVLLLGRLLLETPSLGIHTLEPDWLLRRSVEFNSTTRESPAIRAFKRRDS
ncbi:hypothetical protein ALC57_06086 [Trachymyrmex cornetzi]|uniref:Uncharacterized protein n=1 Tax=Trachymyrmex cornetzi TaxID=471704 RepID=A0A195E8D8_9HYME|nr:hypothetical protein ALC57_06086 [Trachymyrmex cornetzi]